DKLRKQNSTEERKLTVTPFLMKVMAAALKKFPEFNASIDVDNNEIIYKDYLNIGVAVDTDRGLLVPVVRDVDKLSVLELTDELNTMAQKARDKKTLPNDLQGGSMTLTNLGGIGGHAFTPIVNWPEVCILGVSRGGFEPVWNGREFEPRNKLPLSLSYDHRVIDGASAARFLRWICTAIEQPFMMELA
ncbi:MAG: pyruvate dehydrogenase E2 component (dihydrolipoamide acetyltransferase), partial [Lysobacterales bacterium]